MVQKTDRPASFPTWGQVRALVFPGDIEIVNVPITGLGQLARCWVWKCFTDCKVFRCCYVCPQMFSFSTICFNFWKSSNLPSYPLLSVQFSGIKETHIIVQPASPSSHRLFYIKNETMSQLCTNTSFSLLSTPGKHSVPLIFMNLPPLRTSYEWNSDGVFFLSFFLPVVKYTQQKIDHLSIFSAQVSGIKSIHLLCSHHHHASPSSFFLKPEAPLDRN